MNPLRDQSLPFVLFIALDGLVPNPPKPSPLEHFRRELRRLHIKNVGAGPKDMHQLLEELASAQMAFGEAGFVDIHKETAKALWDTPPSSPEEAKARRQYAKSRNFALLYGGKGVL